MIHVMQGTSLDQSPELSHSIVRSVARNSTPIVLDDASNSPEYAMDESISRRKAKSLLLHAGDKSEEYCRILYLENDVVTHTFTPERLELTQDDFFANC